MRKKIDIVVNINGWFFTAFSFRNSAPWYEGKVIDTHPLHIATVMYDDELDKYIPDISRSIAPNEWLCPEDIVIPYGCHPDPENPRRQDEIYILGAEGLADYFTSQKTTPTLKQAQEYVNTRNNRTLTLNWKRNRVQPGWGQVAIKIPEYCLEPNKQDAKYITLNDVQWVEAGDISTGHWEPADKVNPVELRTSAFD